MQEDTAAMLYHGRMASERLKVIVVRAAVMVD
jgi:hypothetical protein